MSTVLVVDDEPQIAQIARDYLRHAGFEVLIARDGPAAVALARARTSDLIGSISRCPGSTASTRPGRCGASRTCRSSC